MTAGEYVPVVEPAIGIMMSLSGAADPMHDDDLASAVDTLDERVERNWRPSLARESAFDDAIRTAAREAVKAGRAELQRRGVRP